MLVCLYRTLTTFSHHDIFYNNISIIIMYTISRSIYILGDSRQMILDLLIWIKSNLDRTLSFRSSCCEGVCGSCAMLINNSNTLACIQPIWLINSYVTVYPLPHFNVIRDLVVDLKHFYEQYVYVNPFYSVYDSSGFSDSWLSSYMLYYLYYFNFIIPFIYSSKSVTIYEYSINHFMYLILYICSTTLYNFSYINEYMGYYLFFNLNIIYIHN